MKSLRSKISRSKKAVSPIIAVLLLIAIAVAAAVITYIWVMGFIGMATTARVTAQGQIQIEDVSISVGGSTAGLYVRNVGTLTVTPDTVYVTDNTAGTTVTVSNVGGTGTVLSAGSKQTLTPTITGAVFTRGHSYTFKVVCTDGTTAVYTTRA
jgi:flagellin-like protein